MKIWIVAAGTGGHIFPGVSLADELKKLNPSLDFLFFGSSNRLETELIPKAGYRIQTLHAGRWKGTGLVGRLNGLLGVVAGVWEAFKLSFKEKPVMLVSVGGYVSVPVALACVLRRVPLYLLEPNIRAGLANRFLSKFAKEAFCVPGSDALNKFSCPTEDSGVPVRSSFSGLKLRPEVSKILVLGGSQGAKALCDAMVQIAPTLCSQNSNLAITLQAGAGNFEEVQKDVQNLFLGARFKVLPFISSMAETLAQSDLVVARAGASTIAELAITGHPTIFVPFPFAADDHQRFNVKLLAEARAAIYVEEKAAQFAERLLSAVLDLSQRDGHFAKRNDLQINFKRWGRPQAASYIAQRLLHQAESV